MTKRAAMAMRLPPVPPLSPIISGLPWPSGGRRVWVASSAVMLATHAGVLALALLWHSNVDQAPPPPAAMMIELAPLAAPPAPPSEKAPGAEQQIARPVARKIEERPKPPPVVKKAEVALPKPVEKKKVEEAPPAEKVVEQTTAPAAAEAPPAPTMAAPASGASFTPPSNAIPTWQGAVRAHLEHHKRYPSTAQLRRQQGVSTVRFTMTRDGRVTMARLERGAGYTLLDEEALALLERAQPLPAMPAEMPGDQLELVVPIQFFLK